MAKSKIKKDKKSYDDAFVAKTLMLIEANGGNISKTARELDMDKSTIWGWWKKRETDGNYSRAVKSVKSMTSLAIQDFKEEHPDFIKKIYDAKDLVLDRMIELVPKEKSLDVLAKVYNALKEEAGEKQPQNQLNVFNQVTQNLLQRGYGTKSSTDQGN